MTRYHILPATSKTLILNAAPLLSHRSSHPSVLLLRLICWLLPKLGYRFTTLSDAVAPQPGRTACLVVESSGRMPVEPSLLETLAMLKAPATLFVPTAAVNEHGASLTWPLLRDLARRGWEIGVLGHEAVDLTTRSYGEQRQLIAKSRAVTAQYLGRAARSFAYPFGAYDATTVSCLKDEGFLAGVSAHQGINGGATDRFQLRQLSLAGPFFSTVKGVLHHALSSASPPAYPTGMKTGSDRDQARPGVAL